MKLPSLNTQIAIGVVLGLGLGMGFAALGKQSPVTQNGLYAAGLVGTLFVDLLKMVLIPLVFASISVGVANLRAHRQIHRVWVATLGFFVLSMAIAIVLGLSAANIFKPGAGLQLSMFADATSVFQAKQMPLSQFFAQLLHGIFQNPVAALAQGNVLSVVVFALILGIALVIGGERYKNLLFLLQELLEITLMLVGWIMRLAPFGIMALLVNLAATQDLALISTLAYFVAVVIGTTLVHGVIALPLILYLVTGVTPWHFWRGAREALITAFATSSSSATLPVTLRCVEQHLHVKRDIAGFVVPLGATVNMDGTALYEAAAALFVANLCRHRSEFRPATGGVFHRHAGRDRRAGHSERRHGDHDRGAAVGRPAARGDRDPAADRPPARHLPHRGQRRGRHDRQHGGAEARSANRRARRSACERSCADWLSSAGDHARNRRSRRSAQVIRTGSATCACCRRPTCCAESASPSRSRSCR